MRGAGIGLLHLFLGVVVAFGWITYGDSAGFIDRPFDSVVHTAWPMGVFILTGAIHGYWSGSRQRNRSAA